MPIHPTVSELIPTVLRRDEARTCLPIATPLISALAVVGRPGPTEPAMSLPCNAAAG